MQEASPLIRSPSIRRAVNEDAEGILLAHHNSIRGLAASDYSREQIAAWTARIFDQAEAERILSEIAHDVIWVVEAQGEILGYAHLKAPAELAPNVYLQALYITPAIAKQGWGRRLMAQMETEALERAAPAVLLHSSKTAVGFYQSLGYELVGTRDNHLVGNVFLERWPMSKALTSQG